MDTILSVTSLTESIKATLEKRFSNVKVQGEVSNLKEQASGHIYFTLKDASSQIAAVLFRGYNKELTRPLRNGDKLILQGEVNLYTPRGAYQLIVRQVEFTGTGELLLKLHELKNKLERLGWFAPAHKKKIPQFPKTIGVVTSPTGAVIQDILHILNRRLENFHLILYPVKVQGEGAAQEIATAINECNRYQLCDVLIVGRGGGSLEDLWAFNEECVATAIHSSSIPIISAVGHETDFSISDFVADLRAPTPSAAAEIVSSEKGKQIQFLKQAQSRIDATLSSYLLNVNKRLDQLKRHPILRYPLSMLEPHFQHIDDLSSELLSGVQRAIRERWLHLSALKRQALALQPRQQLMASREQLSSLCSAIEQATIHYLALKHKQIDASCKKGRLDALMTQRLQSAKERMHTLSAHLQGINPERLLSQGYCILFEEKSSSVILSVNLLQEGKNYRLKLADGIATMTKVQS